MVYRSEFRALQVIACILFVNTELFAQKLSRADSVGDPLPSGVIARLGTARLKGVDSSSVVLSADGTRIAVLNLDLSASVYDTKTARELLRYRKADEHLRCVGISADGKILAVGGTQAIYLLEISSGQTVKAFEHGKGALHLAFSPDSTFLAHAGWSMNLTGTNEDKIRVISLSTGETALELTGNGGRIHGLQYSPNGKMLAFATARTPGNSAAAGFLIADAKSGKDLYSFSQTGAATIGFSPDSKLVVTASSGSIQVRNLSLGKTVFERRGAGPGATFFGNSNTIAVGDNALFSVQLLGIDDGREVSRLTRHRQFVSRVASSLSGDVLVSAGHGEITVWDVSRAKPLHEMLGHRWGIEQILYSVDSGLLATVDAGPELHVWGVAAKTQIWTSFIERLGRIPHVSFGQDNELLVVGSNKLTFHDPHRKTKREQTVSFAPNPLSFARWSGGNVLAIGTTDRIEFLDLNSAKWLPGIEVGPGKSLDRLVGCLAYSPNGLLLASGRSVAEAQEDGNTLQIWDVTTKKLRLGLGVALEGDHVATVGIVFSPSGKYVASFGRGASVRLRLWQTAPPRLLHDLDGSTVSRRALGPGLCCMTFSADEWLLFSGGHDGTIHVWDVISGQKVAVLAGHSGAVTAIACAPNGTSIASGAEDATVLLWHPFHTLWREKNARVIPTEDDVDKAWRQLPASDVASVYAGMNVLLRAPHEAASIIRRSVHPSGVLSKVHVEQLLQDLDSGQAAVRQFAFSELRKLDRRARPFFEAALGGDLSLECRRRIELLLADLDSRPLTKGDVARLRAVQALEWIRTSEASETLRILAKGAPGDLQTLAAQAAINRLKGPSPPKGRSE